MSICTFCWKCNELVEHNACECVCAQSGKECRRVSGVNRNTDTQGFKSFECGTHITFANGYTVSIAWSSLNMCSNRNRGDNQSATAEVAIWKAGDVWHKYRTSEHCDTTQDVAGFMTAEEVAQLLANISMLDS